MGMIDDWFARKLSAIRSGGKPSLIEPERKETAPPSSEKKPRNRDYSVALSAAEWANVHNFMESRGCKASNAASCLDGELTVGANADLVSTDIIQCRVLRVIGTLDAPIFAQKLIIEPGAVVKSTARVGEAEIRGHFEGTLRVHGVVTVGQKGVATGKLRAYKFMVAEGGKTEGDVKRVEPKKAPEWAQAESDDAWVDSFPSSMMSMTLRKMAA